MPLLPRRVTGQRAWWLDVAVSAAAVGAAQALVLNGEALLRLAGREAGGPGFEAAVVLERAPGATSNDLSGLIPLALVLDGAVAGLYPGATAELALAVHNPSQADVVLERLTITVGAPDRAGCPAGALLVGDPATAGEGSAVLDVRIAAAATADLAVPVAMVTGAPDDCQGATFPLVYLAEGSLP